jgi:hypothetical protein
MKAQIPAEGILKKNDWGSSKAYQISCGCDDSEHDHNLWVESDETGINVTVYVNVKSPVWSLNRWQQIWTLMTKGYLTQESTLYMSEQQALNYSQTIKSAITDVEKFKKENHVNK